MTKKSYSVLDKRNYYSRRLDDKKLTEAQRTYAKRRLSELSSSASSAKPKQKKWFSFLAFNDNADVFNVEVYDTSRSAALKQARSKLKRDPEMPCWSVSVTNDNGNENEYFRTVIVDENIRGGVSDSRKHYYRSRDDEIRRKYGGDLSKPLKK